MHKTSKANATILIMALILLPLLSIIPIPTSATITSRPTIFKDNAPQSDPLVAQAGTYVNISLSGMTITGAQVWLWLSTEGSSEVNRALGDRWYAGPFYMGDVINTTAKHAYSFTPPAPFSAEGKTYTYVVGNSWINGTVPFMAQGGSVYYWIKIADQSPRDYIVGSEVGVSNNRLRFTPNFFVTPLSGAPDTNVTVSGYTATAGHSVVYNVTQNGVLVYSFIPSALNNASGWLWTGWSKTFKITDLKNMVTGSPPGVGIVTINVKNHNTTATDATFAFQEGYREVYLDGNVPTFRAHTGNYYPALTVQTGKDYNVSLSWWPVLGSASIYLNSTLVATTAINATGFVKLYKITIPNLTTGRYFFKVIDNHGVNYNFTLQVKMIAYIKLVPDTGHVGDAFTVNGYNFLDFIGKYATIYFETAPYWDYSVLLKNFTVPGSEWSLGFIVPHASGGEREVWVGDITGDNDLAPDYEIYDYYTVLSKIWVTPDPSLNNGTIATVHGTGLEYNYYEGEGYYSEIAYDLCIDATKDIFSWNEMFGYYSSGYPTYNWPNATGDLVTATGKEFQFIVGAGFTGGKHSVALYKEYASSYIEDFGRLPDLDAYYLFTVSDVKENVILAKLDNISKAITDLGGMKTQLTAIQTAITNAQTALSTQITGLSTRLTSIETYAQTAATSAATAASSAAAASTAAAAAKTAAEQASATTATISTAVYGAIVLSLIAALASIVAVITLQKKVA